MPSWLETVWLERYLDRKLASEECEYFEAYMLDKPHLIAEIEADSAVRDGLAMLTAVNLSKPNARSTSHAASSTRQPQRFVSWRPMALAASLVLAWALGWMFAGFNPGGSTSTNDMVIANPPRLVFDTLRGVDTPPLIHPGDPDSQHILVEVGLPSDAHAIALNLPGSETAMPLVLSPDGFVTVLLPRHRLSTTTPLRITYQSAGVERQRELSLPHLPIGDLP